MDDRFKWLNDLSPIVEFISDPNCYHQKKSQNIIKALILKLKQNKWGQIPLLWPFK